MKIPSPSLRRSLLLGALLPAVAGCASAGPPADPAGPGGTRRADASLADPPAAGLAEWWRGRVEAGTPGGVLVVRRRGREVVSAPRGVRDLASGAELEAGTPFYIASVAKPITAALVERLAGRGVLDRDGDVAAFFPELPHLSGVTVRHLLDHTAGVPDYFQWIQWSRFRSLDDAGVVDSLARHPGLEAPPGTRFAYSNSHYVLLSELVRRRTGRSLNELFVEELAAPLGLRTAWMDDADAPVPPGTARGYVADGEGFRLSSYEELDLPGPAPVVTLKFATTGAGGVYMSAPDLARWGEHWSRAVPAALRGEPVPVPADDSGPRIGAVRGYLGGWYVSALAGRTVYWHGGNRGGYGSVLAVVPSEGISIAFLANRSDIVPESVAMEALSRLLGIPPGEPPSP